jgi:hypothetical protein
LSCWFPAINLISNMPVSSLQLVVSSCGSLEGAEWTLLTSRKGIYPNVPMGVAWNGNNIGGSTKRAVGIAMHVGFGNLGGILAAFSYRATDAPRYFAGHGLLIGTTSMSCCLR